MKKMITATFVAMVVLVVGSGCATTGYAPVVAAPVYAPAPVMVPTPIVTPVPVSVSYNRYSRGRSVSVGVGNGGYCAPMVAAPVCYGGYGDSYSQRAQVDAINRAQRARADAYNRAQRAQADAYNRAQRAQADALNRARRR